jgi:hypothetical protein
MTPSRTDRGGQSVSVGWQIRACSGFGGDTSPDMRDLQLAMPSHTVNMYSRCIVIELDRQVRITPLHLTSPIYLAGFDPFTATSSADLFFATSISHRKHLPGTTGPNAGTQQRFDSTRICGLCLRVPAKEDQLRKGTTNW